MLLKNTIQLLETKHFINSIFKLFKSWTYYDYDDNITKLHMNEL